MVIHITGGSPCFRGSTDRAGRLTGVDAKGPKSSCGVAENSKGGAAARSSTGGGSRRESGPMASCRNAGGLREAGGGASRYNNGQAGLGLGQGWCSRGGSRDGECGTGGSGSGASTAGTYAAAWGGNRIIATANAIMRGRSGMNSGKCADPMQATSASCSQEMMMMMPARVEDRLTPQTSDKAAATSCSTLQLGNSCAVGAATGAMPSAWFGLPGAATGAVVGCVVGMAVQAADCERDTQTRMNLAITPASEWKDKLRHIKSKQDVPKYLKNRSMRERYRYNPHCR